MQRLHDARGASAAPVREVMLHRSRQYNRQHREGATPVTGHCTRYRALHPIRTGVMPTDRVHCTLTQEQTQNLQAPATTPNTTTPNTTPPTRHQVLHPLPGTTPITEHCTRYRALHPIGTGVMPTDRVHCTLTQEQTQNLQAPATTPNTTPPTRHRALHPLPGATPVTGHCTRSERVQCLRIGCTARSDKNKRRIYRHQQQHPTQHHRHDTRHYTRYGALHPLPSTTPVTGHYTRSERVQCLRIGCTARSDKNKRGI